MQNKLWVIGFVIAGFLIVSSIIWYGSGVEAIPATGEEHLFPTPEGVTPIPTSARPTLTLVSDDSGDSVPPTSVHATSRVPVSMGPISEVTDSAEPITLPYEVSQVARDNERGQAAELYLEHRDTGQRMRLGDASGHSQLEIATERYVIWKYYPCTLCTKDSERVAGLYVYDWDTQSDFVIIQANHAQWDPHIDGEWLVYRVFNTGFANGSTADLRLHNLESGQDILLDTNAYIPRSSISPEEMYAVHNNSVAWVAVNTHAGHPVVRVYDIDTGSTTTVDVPGMENPINIRVSGDIVIWKELVGGWSGYDRTLDSSFALNFHPPGWENVPRRYAEPVTLANDQLSWAWEVNGKVYRFTAPIVRTEQ